MTKTIATAAFALMVAMIVAASGSKLPTSAASIVLPHTTVVYKNLVFPLPGNITVETCKFSSCADV